MSESMMIEIEGLRKDFKNRQTGQPFCVLDNVNLALRDHEFVSLVGPSGCGKSTLLKLIASFDKPTEGSIRVDGDPVSGPGPDRVMVFQDYALFPWMNTLENVTLGLKINGMGREERMETARSYLEMAGLEHVTHRAIYELSGGMRQRVSIARALALDPKVLLMDEPFGALDAQQRYIMQRELMKIWKETKKTILFVTHSLDEAVFLSDRVVLMGIDPGHIIWEQDLRSIERPRDETSVEFNRVKRELQVRLEDEIMKAEEKRRMGKSAS